MTTEQCAALLLQLGLTRDNDAYLPPDGAGVVVYLGVDQAPLVVDHVTRIQLTDGAVVVTVKKKERREKFGAAVDTILAVQVFNLGK